MYQLGWLHIVLLSGSVLRLVEGQCGEGGNLYPFGPAEGDLAATGDDGPPGELILNDPDDNHPDSFFRFYGFDYTKVYVNLNGQISFGDASDPQDMMFMTEFLPSPAARPAPPFMTPFWNDLFLDGANGTLYYRLTVDEDIIEQVTHDIGISGKFIRPKVVVIMTWDLVSSFDQILKAGRNASLEPSTNIFQVVMAMDDTGLSFAIFNYNSVTWHIAHSLPAVAMFNKGQQSSTHTNLYASGSDLMLSLDDTCSNAGVYGRIIIQTNLRRIRILDQPSPDILANCYFKDNALYPYDVPGEFSMRYGDDGPSQLLEFTHEVTFYGQKFKKVFMNINGPVSFANNYMAHRPTTDPVDQPAFMAAFWNDIRLSGTGVDRIYYRLTTDPDLLEQFKNDIITVSGDIDPVEIVIITWHKVKMYDAMDEDPENTFQVVFGYEGDRSYALFIYARIGWYQDPHGNYAVSVFNKGAKTGVNIDVGPRPGPEFFFRQIQGNSVNKPGMFIFETHPQIIDEATPTCVCRVNKIKWIETFDGMFHPFQHLQKNRMSKYLDHKDPCKFQLTIYTSKTPGGNFRVKWVSFAFGIHEGNRTRLDKDVVFERWVNGTVGIRGRGFNGLHNIVTPFTWTSTDNRTQVQVFGDEYTGWVINSTTCPYRLFYAPRCPDPVVVLTLARARYKPSHLVGMCQDCNGDPHNDYRPCSDDPVSNWSFWSPLPDVSAACADHGTEDI